MTSRPVSKTKLDTIREATRADTDMQMVIRYNHKGWPKHVPHQLKGYSATRAALSAEDGLLLYRDRIAIPASLREEVLEQIHRGHQELTKSREHAKMSVWWPDIGADINRKVTTYTFCSIHKATQRKEPLITTPLPPGPWQKLAADVCELNGKSYLVVVDYYSRDIEIAHLPTTTSQQVPARISACLADISVWMPTHHLKLNLGKTELLFLPAKGSPMIDASITVEGSIVSPSQSARSLGVILDNQLCFSGHIAAITRTCQFSLHNIWRIRPFLTQEVTQLLIQALVISCLDYCNSLLAGLPACAIKPLQLVQNAAARLVFNQPKFTHVTPLLSSLHWLPIAACIRFKSLVLAFQAARARSRLFSVLTPRWWDDLPHSVRTTESLAIFHKRLKTHLFRLHYH
ncbi:hypothetical protein AAFF_G00177540 [Aldrovandia affinis]|uniref:Gypsy retrotransposon integrase-like protein 1 n=1 Tax=Aldrovandia affinis TaxID=143900 RepID=A0AAD7RL36_9TELE|nr:hypothetical protein AAFF_G00177540 [Aldrovandia affinis]